jgi:tRNA(Ile)-lysidine synthase
MNGNDRGPVSPFASGRRNLETAQRRSPAYHFGMRPGLTLDTSLLKPGLRLAVGLSGGADSVALLRALAERSTELGLVLSAAHLHHGLRGEEADGDQEFARELAAKLGIPFHTTQVDVATEAQATPGKPHESIEEAARRLRYDWFRQLMASGEVEAVATAHTRDDQAESVLGKFLRGAWTEGLSGIHPVVEFPQGRILRPLLAATRAEVEAYLTLLGQNWREDSSNAELVYTRNRLRHELLPLLEGWNPQIREHLAQMAELAREEEAWAYSQVASLAKQVLLPGRPVRGGGRASSEGMAIEVSRLAEQPVALQRRLLRFAAEQLGATTDFPSTEVLRSLALTGKAGQRRELAQGLRAERTHRELRLGIAPESGESKEATEYRGTIPGEIVAEAFGIRLRIETAVPGQTALLRNWGPGDRVRLRYSSGLKKVKEVLERLRVTGTNRKLWPVLEVEGQIVWMRGAELEPETGISVAMDSLRDGENGGKGESSHFGRHPMS